MKTQTNRAMALIAAVAALAFPALALAKSDENPRRGADKTKPERAVSWIVKGEVTAKGENTVTVLIKRSNHHGRALRDREVAFDMTNARIVVRDVNGDGARNLADVNTGDHAKLQARRPKRSALGEGEALPAKRGTFKAPEPEQGSEQE
jgi:hypothetical protein